MTHQIADAQLRAKVKTALVNDPVIGTLPIDVRVAGPVVTLQGMVRSAADVDRALALADEVDGVAHVESALEIGEPELAPQTRGSPGLPALAPRPDQGPVRLFGVGASQSLARPSGDALGPGASVGPMVRLRPRQGIGPTVGFSWSQTQLRAPSGPSPLAAVRIRPLMAGIEYGLVRGRLAGGVSLVGGYAFNSLDVDTTRAGPGRAIAVSNSFAWRPAVSVWYDIAPRVGLNLFVGHLFTRPTVTLASDATVVTSRLNANMAIISIGAAYWVF